MPITKVLARGFTVEIKNPDTDIWTKIKNLETLGFSGSAERTPTTDFESGGNAEHILAERSRSLSIEGNYMEDPDTGDRDPGQELVDQAAEVIGADAKRDFRITSPGGNRKEFEGTVEPADIGGGTNEAADWGAEIEVSGEVDIKKAPNGVIEFVTPIEEDDTTIDVITSDYQEVDGDQGYVVLTNVTTDTELATESGVAEGTHTIEGIDAGELEPGDLLKTELFEGGSAGDAAEKLLDEDTTIVQASEE